MQHNTEQSYTQSSYAALSWAKLQPCELCSTFLNYPAATELGCTLLSYAAPYRATLNDPDLRYTLLSYPASIWATMPPLAYAAPTKQCCILSASLHPCELRGTLWAMMPSTELSCILLSYPKLLELGCTPLSSAAPFSATLDPTELLQC